MPRRHLAALMAGAALATVLVGATGATASASTLRPTAASSPAGSTWHGCPYGYICIHIYHTNTEKFSWINLKSCSAHFFTEGINYPTWYINNQTTGTKSEWYADDVNGKWFTPGAPSKGEPPGGVGWYQWVKPCPPWV